MVQLQSATVVMGIGDLTPWLTTSLCFGLVGGLLSHMLLVRRPLTVQLTDRLVWSWHSLRSSLFSKSHLKRSVAIAILISAFVGLSYWPLFVSAGYALFTGLLDGLLLGVCPP